MLFLAKVLESYKAETVYLISLKDKDEMGDPVKVKRAILTNGTTYQSRIKPPQIIDEILSTEPHKDEEKELRDRLKVIRDFKKKNKNTADAVEKKVKK